MNRVNVFPSWLQGHFEYFLDAIRIYLGVGLLIKGISFLMHPELLPQLDSSLAAMVPYVAYIHLIGGAMLALGILPRVAAIANIPILFGAVFWVHLPRIADIRAREGVEFSALVLLLLGMIAIWGAGPISVAQFWRKDRVRPKSSGREWLDDHADLFADLIRIYLGVGLIAKGAYIVDHRDQIFALVNNGTNIPFLLISAAHYVIPAHFVGGALLVLGLLTRWAAIAQLPVLLGAMVFLASPGFAALEQRQSLEFTGLVLFLMALIGVFGAGRFSLEGAEERRHAFRPRILTA